MDGVLYLKVLNAERASYGITNFVFAISQLAQTTLRSEVGKIELDRTFEERTNINIAVVSELDKASDPWGVKVLRYEIKNIKPPRDVLDAMEKQMRAEREKRAVILNSEGIRDAASTRRRAISRKSSRIPKPIGPSRSTKPKEKLPPFAAWPPPPPKESSKWLKPYRPPAAVRPSSFGWPSSTSPNSANWPRKETA